jgi:hypothetical protein
MSKKHSSNYFRTHLASVMKAGSEATEGAPEDTDLSAGRRGAIAETGKTTVAATAGTETT